MYPCKKPTGLIVPPLTPFAADGEVALDAIEPLAAMLLANGAAGVFVCGATGEFPSLTVDERMRVARRWRDVLGEATPLLVHVGGNCLAESQALAAHAQRIGASGIAAVAPFYFRPHRPADLLGFLTATASAAPLLPFYYHHSLARTGAAFGLADALGDFAEAIPTFAGVTYSSTDLKDYDRCLRWDGGRLNLLFGPEGILLAGLVCGAPGAVAGTANVAAPLHRRIMEEYDAGDLEGARAHQETAARLVDSLAVYDSIPPAKAILRHLGLDLGPVRLPLRDLTKRQWRVLRAELDEIRFFDSAVRV